MLRALKLGAWRELFCKQLRGKFREREKGGASVYITCDFLIEVVFREKKEICGLLGLVTVFTRV